MTDSLLEKNTSRSKVLKDKSPALKIVYLILIALCSTFLFTFIGVVLINFTHGINLISNPLALQELKDPLVLSALKLMQILNQVGLFIVPSFLMALLVGPNILNYLSLKNIPDLRSFILVIVLALSALPVINLLSWLNQQMHLPTFLGELEKWMRDSEDNAMKITEAFLKMSGLKDLLINLLIVAFMAALGEELLFRGVIQRHLNEWTKNKHLSIWLTAIIFSAIHMQFFGFIPRMLLGAIFGYLLLWSGSIYLPILAHFVNNASAVLLSYFISRSYLPESSETLGASNDELLYTLPSFFLLILCLVFLYKHLKNNKKSIDG